MFSAFLSYLVIPAFSLFLARGSEPFSTNFSCLRTELSREGEFFLWCALTGGYFFFALRPLMQRTGKKRAAKIPALSAGLILLSALLPYLPSRFPLLSFLHVITALLSSLLLILCLLILSLQLYFRQPEMGRPHLLMLTAAVAFCLSSWILSGIINTAMEVCLVLTASIQIRRFSSLL